MRIGPRGFGVLILALALACPGSPARAAGPDPAGFESVVRPFLDQHCVKCHQAGKAKGGVVLSVAGDLGAVRRGRKLWRGVVEQVEALEMPPSGEPEVAPERREAVVGWLRAAVASVDCGDPSSLDPGPPPARRLTRDEYDRTLKDLLGVPFRSAEEVGMPADGGESGFANLAEALILPPVLMEKYFSAAEKALDLVLDDPKNARARDTLLVARPGPDLPAREAARRVIAPFLRRAYRRPVEELEVARYLALFDRSAARGAAFEESSRLMLKAALVSPHFLFRVEKDRGAGLPAGASYRVGDHELAARLSYFLWSSMPDRALSEAADRGELSTPEGLEREVRRMLADSKSRAFTDALAGQWLQADRIHKARPSTEFFPTFTPRLRQALWFEVFLFVHMLREEDRDVRELLDCDYAYLNADLAEHYGIPGVAGDEQRRVALPPGSHRGGILGMGGILAMTSHTSRTSPTLRGKYILEVVFGTPPPPPPPDAGQLPEGQAKGEGPKSFREQMARHARQSECAGCHAKIDPLGYALENYDAVGRWRVDDGGRPLDASGKLPGGESFDGADALKRVILGRKDEFERNLVERALSYALGREVRGDDECAIRAIREEMGRSGHRFSSLVLGVARSVPFQYRRDAGDREPKAGDRP